MEEKRATHSGILARIIPWTEEPGELHSMGIAKESVLTEQLSMHTQIIVYFSVPDYKEFGAIWSAKKDLKMCFHSSPKEGQCQRMFKALHSGTCFTCLQGHAQNPISCTSTLHTLRTSRCTSWIWKRQRN